MRKAPIKVSKLVEVSRERSFDGDGTCEKEASEVQKTTRNLNGYAHQVIIIIILVDDDDDDDLVDKRGG